MKFININLTFKQKITGTELLFLDIFVKEKTYLTEQNLEKEFIYK